MSFPPHTALSDMDTSSTHEELSIATGGAVLSDGASGSIGAAFTHIRPLSMALPVLIAVPHAGRAYPAEVLAQMRDPELCQLRLEDRHVDQLGVEIAKATGAGLLVAHAPRAMLDLNRAHDDVDWDMVHERAHHKSGPSPVLTSANHRARSGLGLFPRRLPGFGEIWRRKLTVDEMERRIDSIHRPYHSFLSKEIMRVRDEWGCALLIDLHSMPPLRRQSGQNQAPKIVIGDRFGASCDGSLVANAFRHLDSNGWPASHNRPYSGGYVLERHASPARGIFALQIEVCRSTYLDQRLAEISDGLKDVARLLSEMIRTIGQEAARSGDAKRIRQAAE